MRHPNLYIIAGPNGAGKTTASYTLLPDMLGCKNFVNAALGKEVFAMKQKLLKLICGTS